MKEDTMAEKINDLCISPKEALRAMGEYAKEVSINYGHCLIKRSYPGNDFGIVPQL